jgi:hypothetical protein
MGRRAHRPDPFQRRQVEAIAGYRRILPLVLNLFPFHAVSMSRAHEDLQYTVEEWATDDSRLIEVLASAGSLSVAYAAYPAASVARPWSRIVHRQRAHDPSR